MLAVTYGLPIQEGKVLKRSELIGIISHDTRYWFAVSRLKDHR